MAAGERDDPRTGTAPPAGSWLLLEHPGPWAVEALAGAGIDSEVLAELTGQAARSRTRILLVRRPGRTPPRPRRWMLASPGLPTVVGPWSGDPDLRAAVAALRRPAVAGGGPPAEAPDPLLLVCAHGVHDACCAIRGRPVAAALAQRWPDRVWECSHVGGDRFAPNVLVLPDGYYYGGLDPVQAVATVEQHLAGRVRTEHLRGMAAYPPAQQAAVVAALERYGPLAAGAVRVSGARHEGEYGSPSSRTFVDLQLRGGPALQAEVVTRRRPPARLTCRAERDTTATEYVVERLG